MKTSNRNVAVDFWRLIFVSLIVLVHTVFLLDKGEPDLFRGGYIGVEFFFVVSGYLMVASANKAVAALPEGKNAGASVYDILKRKIKGFFPDLLFACVVAFIVRQFALDAGITDIVKNAIQGVYVPMLMYSTGVKHFGILGQTWYISSMMLVMPILLLFLVRKNNTFFRKVAAPLIYALILGYLSLKVGHLNVTGKIGNFPYGALLRAAMGLCGGCISYSLTEYVTKTDFSVLGQLLLTILETGGYIAVIVCTYFYNKMSYDFICSMIFVIAVGITFSGKSYTARLINGTLGKMDLKYFSRYTLCIYLYNNIFHYIDWGVSMREILPYYLLYSYLFPIVGMILTDLCRKLFGKIGSLLIKQTQQ